MTRREAPPPASPDRSTHPVHGPHRSTGWQIDNLYEPVIGGLMSTSALTVPRGACVCLLGRNGVGKTTILRSVMGLTPASTGQVIWKGEDITRRRPFEIARAGIGFVPEDRRIFADLSVRENLEVGGRAAARPGPWSIDAVFDLFPKLRELSGRRGGYLSGGEQQMLTIGRTLMGNPELLLLDEPSEGLAPLVVESILEQGC